jgi:hypothetical protein
MAFFSTTGINSHATIFFVLHSHKKRNNKCLCSTRVRLVTKANGQVKYVPNM